MGLRLLLALALAAFAGASGCGGSPDPDATELASKLPSDSTIVGYIDLDAARAALELPDDASPADETRLAKLGSAALTGVLRVPDPDFTGALQLERASAVAGESSDGNGTTLLTGEFDEAAIEEELGGQDYGLESDVLVPVDNDAESPDPNARPSVALGDDLIAVSLDPAAAAEVLAAGPQEDTLVATLEPTLGVVTTLGPDCLSATAAVEDLSGGGKIIFETPRPPDPDLLNVAEEIPVDVDEPIVDGNQISVELRSTEGKELSPASAALSLFTLSYVCEEADAPG